MSINGRNDILDKHRGEVPLPANLADTALRVENGWAAWSGCDVTKRIRKVLGITETIAKDFSGSFVVDGHTVFVCRHDAKPYRTETVRYFHRVFFIVNNRYIPASRIVQHFGGGNVYGRTNSNRKGRGA